MNEIINRIIDVTQNPSKYISNAKSLQCAEVYNGRTIKTNKNISGIICAYLGSMDFWIYWIDIRTLTHYTHIPVSKLTVDKTTALDHEHIGEARYEVPQEHQLSLLELAKEFNKTIAKPSGPLKLGDDKYRQIRKRLKSKEEILYCGKVYSIAIPNGTNIKIFGSSEEEVWDFFKTRCLIEEVG
jgi:hypothetical protein